MSVSSKSSHDYHDLTNLLNHDNHHFNRIQELVNENLSLSAKCRKDNAATSKVYLLLVITCRCMLCSETDTMAAIEASMALAEQLEAAEEEVKKKEG